MTLNPVLDLVLSQWIPPLISVLLGGLIASILVPRWQTDFEKARLYDKRKLELLEKISEAFPRYVVNWNHLNHISIHEAKKEVLIRMKHSVNKSSLKIAEQCERYINLFIKRIAKLLHLVRNDLGLLYPAPRLEGA